VRRRPGRPPPNRQRRRRLEVCGSGSTRPSFIAAGESARLRAESARAARCSRAASTGSSSGRHRRDPVVVWLTRGSADAA
jgi:hypothetical protein